MLVKRTSACTHLSQLFPSNSTRKFKSSPFWPPNGYTPGTTAVNVSWIEREFNAGQMHRSMCPSIFNRLRAIASYWSEIATFSYPLAFNAPIGGVPIGIPGKSLVLIKLDSWGYQAVKTV